MSEVKGTYVLMMVQLLSEFNPEIVEEASKELSEKIGHVDKDENNVKEII